MSDFIRETNVFSIDPSDYRENPQLWEWIAPSGAEGYFKPAGSDDGTYFKEIDGDHFILSRYGSKPEWKKAIVFNLENWKNVAIMPERMRFNLSPSRGDLDQPIWKNVPDGAQKFFIHNNYIDVREEGCGQTGVYYKEIPQDGGMQRFYWDSHIGRWLTGANHWDKAVLMPSLSTVENNLNPIDFEITEDKAFDLVFWEHNTPEGAKGCMQLKRNGPWFYFKDDPDNISNIYFLGKEHEDWVKVRGEVAYRKMYLKEAAGDDEPEEPQPSFDFENQPEPGWIGWVSSDPEKKIWEQCTVLHNKTLYRRKIITSIIHTMVFVKEPPTGNVELKFG